ncbi:MAG: PmoA family protein [Verrucomicrobiae bacterium]|nr:PmoA family protein [Verrucomicrobiae bacterium]
MNTPFRHFAWHLTVAMLVFTSRSAHAENIQSIKVTPQANVEYAEVVTTLIDSRKLKGLTAVGIRPSGQQYQLMGQLVPRGKETELRFILEKGVAGESQIFDVILDKPTVALPEIFTVKEGEEGVDIYYNKRGISLPLTRMMTDDPLKVFNHVFDARGGKPITSGGEAGSVFPHHRGIFLGWSKTGFNGKTYDTWHMKDGVTQKFEKLVSQNFGPMYADFTANISWNTGDGQKILAEQRTIKGLHPTNKGYGMMEIDTVLTAPNGDVVLDGDPEHAGCHFRANNETAVVAKAVMDGKAPKFQATKYVFHKEGIDPTKDKDLPWVTMGFSVGEDRFFTQHMTHPDNPTGSVYSAYRDYGRFGSFFTHTIKKGESLRLRYRFIFGIGAMPPAPFMQASYDAFATPAKVELVESKPAEPAPAAK